MGFWFWIVSRFDKVINEIKSLGEKRVKGFRHRRALLGVAIMMKV